MITHFGMRVVQENPETQARWIQEKTGVRTVAARDFMMLDMGGDDIAISDRIKSHAPS